MSSFFAQLSLIEARPSNRHAEPTPGAVAAAERLLHEQFRALQTPRDGGRTAHADLLDSLMAALAEEMEAAPRRKIAGVPQSFLDGLERVPKRALRKGDVCPICNEEFLEDAYPLVVQLPCHESHCFDLECVGPWLRLQGTCPMDRKEMVKKKEVVKVEEEEDEEEDYDEMFA